MKPRWLVSPRADFWFASAAGSGGLLAAIALIVLHGDRELDWLDLVLSELHLGATYDAIVRRRLWRRLPLDVVIVPFCIVAATYALIHTGSEPLLTSIGVYAAIWHRGRQSFGVARFYQAASGPVSAVHNRLFLGAIYLPMAAAAWPTVTWGVMAAGWVSAYVFWFNKKKRQTELHPGETWIVIANAVAFGSAYALGISNPSFLFVLTVHHEVQYLYFTYAVARRSKAAGKPELGFAASFALWPVIGLAGALSSSAYNSEWLAALGLGGLFCHYWLDGRIWTRRAMGHV